MLFAMLLAIPEKAMHCANDMLPSYAEGGGTKVDTSVFANVFEMSFTYYEGHSFFFPLYRYYILGAISFIE